LIQTLNTGGHEVVRATIPSKIHGSHTSTYRRRNPKGENKNGGGKGDGGSLILFNKAITQSPICFWI
jgi:hypothetical protein